MALATRCPNCHALFRVVADQLKLRGGLVRCGACRHVFDAIGSLTYLDEAATGVMQTAPTPPIPKKSSAPPTLFLTDVAPAPPKRPRPPRPQSATAETSDDPGARALDVPTLLAADATAEASAATPEAKPARAEKSRRAETKAKPERPAPEPETPPAPAASKQSAEPLRQRVRRRIAAAKSATLVLAPTTTPAQEGQPAAAAEYAPTAPVEQQAEGEPAFLRGGRKQPLRGFSVVFGGGSVLLAIFLVAQLAVLFRTDLITRWPALRPPLVGLCHLAGCTLGWPTRSELLAVVGTELQAIPGTDVLELTATIRNRAPFKLALPALEVTLTDTQNRTLARKVFAPVDYLASAGEPSERLDDGLASGADQTIKITFEARGVQAAGFVVYPFYL